MGVQAGVCWEGGEEGERRSWGEEERGWRRLTSVARGNCLTASFAFLVRLINLTGPRATSLLINFHSGFLLDCQTTPRLLSIYIDFHTHPNN